MKRIRSMIKLVAIILMATLTQMTQAAAITPDGKNDLVALYLVMYGRAPTSEKLAEIVAARESGSTLAQVATTLSAEADFAFVASKDVDAFATFLADTLLPPETPAAGRDWAMNWTITQLQGTMTKAQVIAQVIEEIRGANNPMFAAAKAKLVADVANAQITAPSPTSVPVTDGLQEKKTAATSALNDLIEIAEDLTIEEEDNSAYYKQVLEQSGGTDKPSATLKKLLALKQELVLATTVDAINAIQEKMKPLQAAMNPWVSFAGTNIAGSSKNLTDDGLRNIQAINARAISVLTGSSGGGSCRSVYNTTTHSFQTVCN